MSEIYEIDEKTRIRRMDSMNYTVETYRGVKRKDGSIEFCWVGAKGQSYGPFFGNLGAAVRWIIENKASNAKNKDLKGFLASYERIGDEIVAKITEQIKKNG